MGRITKANRKANRMLANAWREWDIHFCEACPVLHELGHLDWGCMQSSSNAHRHERLWYRGQLEKLYDYKQVIRACMKAHKFIDEHKDIREQVFMVLRGKENV